MRYGRHGHELSNTPTTGAVLTAQVRQVAPGRRNWYATNLTTIDGTHLFATDQLGPGKCLYTDDGRCFVPRGGVGYIEPGFRPVYEALLRITPGSTFNVHLTANGRVCLRNGIPADGAIIRLPGNRTVPLTRTTALPSGGLPTGR